MKWRMAVARVRALFRRRALQSEMDEEVRFHLEMEAARREQAVDTREQARRSALVAFGGECSPAHGGCPCVDAPVAESAL
jgi:hypothetical protein